MSSYDFPFTIEQVAVDLLQLTVRRKRSSGDLDIDCPFCGKKGKLNTSAKKNSFSCVICNSSGGMVVLYAMIHGIDNKDAYREICELLNCGKSSPAAYNGATKKIAAPLPTETQKADRETTHQTYSMMLSRLSLANPHNEQLLARGLSSKDIERFGYKSVPAYGQKQLCKALIETGCCLDGVPGFFRYSDGEWGLKLRASGILIPVCDLDGKIEAMQIRLDKPINDRKYIWLSSKEVPDGAIVGSGASSGSPLHFVGDPAAKRVFVTEGALKGAAAYSLSHRSFICLPGVNNIKGLAKMLTTLKAIGGAEEIFEAFDSDKYENEHVAEATKKLHEEVLSLGFNIRPVTWADKSLKGIDDYFLARWKERQTGIYGVDVRQRA